MVKGYILYFSSPTTNELQHFLEEKLLPVAMTETKIDMNKIDYCGFSNLDVIKRTFGNTRSNKKNADDSKLFYIDINNFKIHTKPIFKKILE